MKKQEKIIEMVQSGRSATLIAKELKCSRQCVYNYVVDNDEKLLHLIFNEMSPEEVLNIQSSLYFDKMTYTKDRIRQADEMFLRIKLTSPIEISETLDYSTGTLYNRYKPSGDWGVWGMISELAEEFKGLQTPQTFTEAVRASMVHPQRLRQAVFGTNF